MKFPYAISPAPRNQSIGVILQSDYRKQALLNHHRENFVGACPSFCHSLVFVERERPVLFLRSEIT
jgi:hypothetical protein